MSKSPVKDYLAISHNLDVPFKRIRGRAVKKSKSPKYEYVREVVQPARKV